MTSLECLSLKNPSCVKTKFAHKFLRALRRIKKRGNPKGSHRRIKMAADASMASVVGSRRAWSRAILQNIRYRGWRRRRSYGNFRRRRECNSRQVDKLKDLVPGGETMDLFNLLDETADYIKSLTNQVHVMRSILDFCST